MLRMIHAAGVVTIALLFCGCSTVYSPEPIGEPVDLSGEIDKWEGTWVMDGESTFTVKVVDAGRGVLKALNMDSESDPELIYITRYQDWFFANMSADDQEADSGKYYWGRILKNERVAILWAPDPGKIIEHVKEGAFPGTIDYGDGPRPKSNPDVHLGRLDTVHLDRLVSQTDDLLFVWDSPMVFMKIDQPYEPYDQKSHDDVSRTTSSAEEPAITGDASLEVISIHPGPQATLNAGEEITVKIRYSRAGDEPVRVWAQPYIKDGPSPDGFYSPSRPEPAGAGELERSLGFNGPVVLDEIHISMIDAETRNALAEIVHPVNLTWEGTIPGPETIAPVGQPFPELKFISMQGDAIEIAALKGKVVLIDFWATWCGPCVEEMPGLLAAYEKFNEQGFEIVGVSLDRSREALESYIQQNDVLWPQYFDGKGWDNEIVKTFAIRRVPFTFLIDREGVVRYIDLRGKALFDAVQRML